MKKHIVWIVLAVSVLAAAVVLFLVFNKDKGKTQTVPQSDLNLGDKYLSELNYENAIAKYEDALNIEPNNIEAYMGLARAYEYMGDKDKQKETLEKAYEISQNPVIKAKLDALSGEGNTPGAAEGGGTVENVAIGDNVYPSNSTTLILRECDLADDDLAELEKFTELEWLDLSGNKITDLSIIAKLPNLKRLYVSNNAITDVSPLSSCQSLEFVGMRGNQISSADALFELPNIKYLHLTDNKIQSISKLSDSLLLVYVANNPLKDKKVLKNTKLLYCDTK